MYSTVCTVASDILICYTYKVMSWIAVLYWCRFCCETYVLLAEPCNLRGKLFGCGRVSE